MADRVKIELPEKPGALLFMVAFCLLSIVLAAYLGDQTKFSAKGKLFAQPRFWPAVGVIGMTVFSALHILQTYRRSPGGGLAEAGVWLRGLEYVAWFMVYVSAVPVIGYLPATILFTAALALRVGYRTPGAVLAAVATGVAIVVVFKTFLSVKIPGGAVYEYLPAAFRNFMILNF